MICAEALTAEQRAVSQKNYNWFNIVNGLSYMCLGETVLILLAVQIGCKDYQVAALGAMMYLGFLLLPWGRVRTAKVGAAKSQADFWVARNVAALLVASAAPLNEYVSPKLAVGALLLGAFMFYGFRAAGVVMSQPLIGAITTDVDRGALLAKSGGYFYASCFAALIAISVVLGINEGLWMLVGIIIAGSALGCTASRFLAKIDETEAIRTSARRPIKDELRRAATNKSLRQQLFSGFAINIAIIMLVPVSMLALKKGYGVSDTRAMFFALGQFGASAGMSFITGMISRKIGPRKLMLWGYVVLLSLGLYWQVVPEKAGFCAALLVPVFLLAGGVIVSLNNSNVHYFLQTIPEDERVTSSMFLSVFTGVGAGLSGMLLSGGILKLCAWWRPDPDALLDCYRLYFLLAAVVLLPGLWLIYRLTPLAEEKRDIKEHHLDYQVGNRVNFVRNSERILARNRKKEENTDSIKY